MQLLISKRVMFLALRAALVSLFASKSALADPRLVHDAATPSWLNAVGRLTVPTTRSEQGRIRHFTEDCTATLVETSSSSQADTLVTAWHCLENYSDLSHPIVFTLTKANGDRLVREARLHISGNSMHADWAVLKLASYVLNEEVPSLELYEQSLDSAEPVMMAGYSKDTGLGESGSQLTYDPHCLITALSTRANATDCVAHKGASGGPVVQIDNRGRIKIVGVVSEGDGQGYSSFVDVNRFRRFAR